MRDDKGRFVPGVSGNPGGRPRRGETFTDILLAHITKEEMAAKLAEHINNGDLSALRYALDRTEGKPVETVNQTVLNLPEVIAIDLSDDDDDTTAEQTDTETMGE